MTTIIDPNEKTEYTANGISTKYDFDFRIAVYESVGNYLPRKTYDITVYVNDVKKTYTTDYSITAKKTGYGHITFVTPPANGATIKLVRENYAFFSLPLPENSNLKNVFLTLITSGVFCYNRTEVFALLDKYNDKWQPVNSLAYNSKWFNDYATDYNPNSSTDIEKAIEEYETYIGKENITGFTFHVPWYWRISDDSFVPLNTIQPVTYEGNPYLNVYKKAKNEGSVHFDNTKKTVVSITRPDNGGTARVTVTNHGWLHAYNVTITGCEQVEYNGTHMIYNVTTNTFDFTVDSWTVADVTLPPTPATGTIKASRSTLVNATGGILTSNTYNPTCGGIGFQSLEQMPTIGGIPIFGGTPDDAGLQEAIAYVKTTKGYKFIFYAFTEVAVTNKPWRGNLLPTVRTIPQLLDDIKSQCTYYAQKLVDWNLRPYAFVTCSEMKEINRHKTYVGGGTYTDDTGAFNFTAIAKWKEIYDAVKAIFAVPGWTDVLVGYSADWSELNGFTDDQGYYWRQLDELVMYQDAVFIDAYYGTTEEHATKYQDYLDGWFQDRDYYPGYYISDYDLWKDSQGGTSPITASEYALKDLDWWMNNTHDHVGPSPTYTRIQTPWTIAAKKILFVETGCPSIDSGSTEPNLFYDPDAVQGGISKGSSLTRKDIVQYYYLKSLIENINNGSLPVSLVCVWQCDSRALSTLIYEGNFFWGDTYRVPYVHWLKYLSRYYDYVLEEEEPEMDDYPEEPTGDPCNTIPEETPLLKSVSKGLPYQFHVLNIKGNTNL